MANHWLRLWHDMPNDPKWRTIARTSGESLALVTAVYMHLLVDASRNVTRGHITVTQEDLASALDVTEPQIVAIFIAMEGRVLENGYLSGWEKRQPKREDFGDEETGTKSAAQRKKEQREREKLASAVEAESGQKPQCHDASRNVTLDKDKDKDKKEPNGSSRATKKCPPSFELSDDMLAWASMTCPDASIAVETEKLRDHTFKTARSDWPGTWRNWMRKAHEDAASRPKARTAPESFKASDDREARARWEEMTGRQHPDNLTKPKPAHGGMVVDIAPKTLEISQ